MSSVTEQTVSLDDKYVRDEGKAYMTGIQALVRLVLAQHRRDACAGVSTGAFISGYRGSPLGNFDMALWQAERHLASHNVVFRPGVNEDLAATAMTGTQQAGLTGQGKHDGVVGWWYGKGPGVDRSGDAFRHANLWGTSKHGGVVALYGDDHSCKSSSIPHQSEHVMMGVAIPIFYPTSVQQILDYGVHAVALSRLAGLYTSMKLVSEIVETSASVDAALDRVRPDLGFDYAQPPGGLHVRWPDRGIDQEERLYAYRLPAALAYLRANRLSAVTRDSPNARIGIVASGKGYLDMIEALRLLGVDGEPARRIGLRVYQVGMIWPLEPFGLREFAAGLDEIIVVEEKRSVLEAQIKDELYALPDGKRPRVVGKSADGRGEWSTPGSDAPLIGYYELQPEPIAKMLAARLLKIDLPEDIRSSIEAATRRIEHAEREARRVIDIAERKPYFCSGCPHNTSTRLPEGSRALGGIGCHHLALYMDRGSQTFTQMGGEGANWVGAAPFTNEPHVFVNIGDGTYFHSGYMAIRQAVAANVNVTYKILYNDAVGMTGGQPVDGVLGVPQLTRQLAAEGVGKIVVVSDETDLVRQFEGLAPGVTVRHRDELETVQRELRETKGVSALVYAQTCASEKRRRRKRKEYPDPDERVYINHEVCEGCGDCSVKSNCLSVEPLPTELGIKRRINQSSCNKDFSCVDGFCPSFVTVHARDIQPMAASGSAVRALPEGWPTPAVVPGLEVPYRIVLAGVGGTGVITIGALLGMAAHLEGKAVCVMDNGGMAQKGGTVYSYVQFARVDDDIAATKVAGERCDLLLGTDTVVSGHSATLSRLKSDAIAVLNQDGAPTSEFIRSRDWLVPVKTLVGRIAGRVPSGKVVDVPASRIAERLLGDAIYANMLLLGVAWQTGRLPLTRASVERAIELNGAAVAKNMEAFRIGCHLAADPTLASRLLGAERDASVEQSVDATIADRAARLKVYWNARYAARYESLMRAIDPALPEALRLAAARQLYRVMAYKDEYEVARLLSSSTFRQEIDRSFGAGVKVSYHLAPPALSGKSSPPKKKRFGSWLRTPLALLARGQWLRETPFDVFGRTDERRRERAWRDRYIEFVASLAKADPAADREVLLQIANLPEDVRGFGHVKLKAMDGASKRWEALERRLTQMPASSATTFDRERVTA